MIRALRVVADVPPLTPDGDEAREWARRELADPVYAAAEPTPLDRVARAIAEFFEQLFGSDLPGGWGSAFAIVATVVVVVLIGAALFVWGLPRATRRSGAGSAVLFGVADERTASQLRRDAAALAAQARWDEAIVLRFRALARGIVERGAVHPAPGATAHAFARAGARAFPAHSGALESAASAFDDVRYLRRPGTADLYARVESVDDAIVATRPLIADEAEARR